MELAEDHAPGGEDRVHKKPPAGGGEQKTELQEKRSLISIPPPKKKQKANAGKGWLVESPRLHQLVQVRQQRQQLGYVRPDVVAPRLFCPTKQHTHAARRFLWACFVLFGHIRYIHTHTLLIFLKL